MPANAREIFDHAVERHSPAEWTAFVNAACEGDAALAAKVWRLLEAHAARGSFMAAPALGPAPTAAPTGELLGEMIGPYKLMEQIGEGGMGVVYVAEQKSPIKRHVALKVIKPGMDTRQVVARFEAERQALALMDHPHIARVIDGGTTDQGRPYFVMELVRGVAITEFCDAERFTIRQRLELFMQVCQAVQHAHQKGIIHRDLKPSNVLVMRHDEQPIPKVIDFGVAKAVNQSLTDKTIYTQFAQMIGTPLYMSPEQAQLSGLDIDTRSDVYSLGVLLYELLTGTTPFDGETLRAKGLDEMRRIIREEEPAHPSRRISTLAAEVGSTVSSLRAADPRRLKQVVHGELDWIALRALEKDRARRYQSAGDFAEDVRRYLKDEPVAASPPSRWYRVRKSLRKHRTAAVSAALVALALLTSTGVSLWQAHQANLARILADQRLAESEASYKSARAAIRDVLALIATDKVIRTPGMREVYLEMLDMAIAAYAELIAIKPHDPEVHADQAELHLLKGEWEGAQRGFQKAIDLAPNNARNHFGLAKSLEESWPQKAEFGIEDANSTPGADGWQGPTDEARFNRALVHVDRALELTTARNVEMRLLRAALLYRLDRADEAFDELAQAENMTPHSAAECVALAEVWYVLGEREKCERYAQQAVTLDPTDPLAHLRVAQACILAGRQGDAIPALTESIRLDPQVNSRDWPYKLQLRGDAYLQTGKHAEALADLDAVLQADPHRWHLYKRRAKAHFLLNDFDASIADLRTGYKMRPADESLFAWLPTEKVVRCGNERFIQDLFELAGSQKGKLGDLHAQMAHYRIELKDIEGAVSHLKRAEELEPGNFGDSRAARALLAIDGLHRSAIQAIADENVKRELERLRHHSKAFAADLATRGPRSSVTRKEFVRLRGTRDRLAVIDREKQQWDKVVEAYRETFKQSGQVLGPEHRETASAQHELGIVYLQRAEHRLRNGDANRAMEDVLCAMGLGVGDWLHSAAVQALQKLGSPYSGQIQQAREKYLETVVSQGVQQAARFDGDLDRLGPHNPLTHQSLVRLRTVREHQVDLLDRETQSDRIVELRTDLVSKYREVYGREHSATKEVVHTIENFHRWRAEFRIDRGDAEGCWQDINTAEDLEPQNVNNLPAVKKLFKHAAYRERILPLAKKYNARIAAKCAQHAADFDRDFTKFGPHDPATRRAFEQWCWWRDRQVDSCIDPPSLPQQLAWLDDKVVKIRTLWGEPSPELFGALNERAQLHLQMNQPELALDVLEKHLEQPTAAIYNHYTAAMAGLAAGDREAYRRICGRMLTRLGEKSSNEDNHWVVWAAIIVPEGLEHQAELLAFAQRAVEREPADLQSQQTVGAMHFRLGQHAQAKEHLAIATEIAVPGITAQAYSWYFLAMTEHHLGHREQATAALAKAQELREKLLTDDVAWNRRLTLNLLEAEARTLIEEE